MSADDSGTSHDRRPADRPRVGVSACLLGWEVRYAGGHKWNVLVAEEMGRRVEWIPVCPELEIGLGVPREAIELLGDPAHPELVGTESGRRLGSVMRHYATRRLDELARHGLSGYVLKARSPSCGPRGVPVYPEGAGDAAEPVTTGTGLFARALAERFPGLPIVDETELTSPDDVAAFVARVYAYRR
jgi:uncharacterized protein YbbK (DUF523 family)